MRRDVVITGIGMLTPLGRSPAEVLARVRAGRSARRPPAFDTSALLCRWCAPIPDFRPEAHVEDGKSLRLMSRDAALAVAAARLAAADAGLEPGRTYPAEEIALYGSTGMTGMPAEEVAALVRHSAGADGGLDLRRFGRVTLRRVRPVLSFKILANMPICFVSIFGNIRGANGIYAPWEGQGAQAIVAGIRAVEEGLADCAVAGGCDVRTHEFAFVSLRQLGAFRSWAEHGEGPVPGEGAAFLVLEEEGRARARGARAYARLAGHALGTAGGARPLPETLAATIAAAAGGGDPSFRPGMAPGPGISGLIAAGDGERSIAEAESQALERAGLRPPERLHPKRCLGNLYAAAAAVQVALAAEAARRGGRGTRVLADCFGHGSQQGAFLLEGG